MSSTACTNGNAEGAPRVADGRLQPLRIECVAHELDAARRAAAQARQHGIGLVRQEGHEHEIVGDGLVEGIGDRDGRPFTLQVDDGAVASELLVPLGARPGDDADVVAADAGQLEGEGAADLSGTDDGDPE